MVCAICGRMPLMMHSDAHEAGSRNSLEEMLGNQRIDRRHTSDVDDGKLRARCRACPMSGKAGIESTNE